MRYLGGIVPFYLQGGAAEVNAVLARSKLFTLAASLGGVESLVCVPVAMTHASVPAERRAVLGIGDNLIRLSVGLESEAALIADLDHALKE